MAEEIQTPTQTSEAPQTEATPGDQAGSLRQSQDPPAGDPPVDSAGSKTYSQEYVNRLKASAEGSKAEVDRLKSTQNQQNVIEKYRESQTQQMQPQQLESGIIMMSLWQKSRLLSFILVPFLLVLLLVSIKCTYK